MDVRAYYAKVREAEANLPDEYVVLVSFATPEGGKAGVLTEAPREIAARLIAEGRARAASEQEATNFHDGHRAAKARNEREEAARRIQVMVIPSPTSSEPRADPEKPTGSSKRDQGTRDRG